jgi:raffinose/stachyose/melibiose transport system permease protein
MRTRRSPLSYLFLIVISLVFFVPIYITIINAFKIQSEIMKNPFGFSANSLTLENLKVYGFSPYFNIIQAYFNTIVIVGLSILGIIICTSMLSYVMDRNRENAILKVFYVLMLAGLIIPPESILLSIVQILRNLGLMFTYSGLVLRNIGWYVPFSCFVFVGYVKTISRELDESAYLDGAGAFSIYSKIIFPLMKPAVASVFIFCFLWIWNDFLNPLIILGDKTYTVTIGIYRAIGQYSTAWDQIFSLVFLVSIPVLVMYVFMQKYFIEGLTAGAVKG